MNQPPPSQTLWPSLDVFVNQTGDFIIVAEISQLHADNLDLNLESNRFTISGARPDPDAENKSSVMAKEIPRGNFRRVVNIPADFDMGAAKAVYLGGVLRITVPAKARGWTSPSGRQRDSA